MADDVYKKLPFERASNRTGHAQEIHLEASEIDASLRPETLIGILQPEEFVSYLTYTGGPKKEYLCEVLTIDNDMQMLSPQEIHDLRNETIDASSLSEDGFVTERILRYDFKKDGWETVTSDYYAFDSNDQFMTLLSEEREAFIAAQLNTENAPTHD